MSFFSDNDYLAMKALSIIAKFAYIDPASGSVLDNWGKLYGLRRRPSDNDFDYRHRISECIRLNIKRSES
jgi:hypothetical protein